MLSYLYFVIRPTADLTCKASQLPRQFDLIHDLICPQLFSKKQYDRTSKPLDVVRAEVKRAFLAEFRRRLTIALHEHSDAKHVINLEEFRDDAFDKFWSIEIFEDCEELDD